MKLKKKKKWTFLLLNASSIFILSAGCSNVSKTPILENEKLSNTEENLKNQEKAERIKNSEQITQSKTKKETPKKTELAPVPKPANNSETKEKENKPIFENKEEPKIADKFIIKPFNPQQEQKQTDIELAHLKGYLSTLPNTLYVTNSLKSSLPQTIIYSGNGDKKNFSYVNFVLPIQNLDEKYEAKLDFSRATAKENREKNPIENVFLVLSLKENSTVSASKKINILYEEKQNEFSLKAKILPDDFKHIFPSFLAFALLNKDKSEGISLPIFNNSDFILNGKNFGLGLKNSFVEFSKADSDNNKYGFDIISTQPDDENGKLKINFQLWKIGENTEIKEVLPKIETLEFTGLAKNSDNNYEINLAKQDLEIKLAKDENWIKNKDLNSDFVKNGFLKILLDMLHVRINANINNKWIKLSEAKWKKWLVFPQIQYANLESTQLVNNLELKKEGNKISWNLKLDSFLLENNQALTPESELLFGTKKTHEIKGEFTWNENK
ncbi:LppA-related lipoprotein [Mesomycoplasma flocculare]|uniref:Lipoprotein n=1 Tax=Mesomycoplasma flocculare ATCC 27399 TaxID=743971 RepID=A0A0A8E854_MESFC|nr:hypothetical protein [Mesomycoplasma flocculare]AJC50129.1 lipoprotein [Mesomycoplasma flocculare ATCC 27399]